MKKVLSDFHRLTVPAAVPSAPPSITRSGKITIEKNQPTLAWRFTTRLSTLKFPWRWYSKMDVQALDTKGCGQAVT